jgi:hypothetical protein
MRTALATVAVLILTVLSGLMDARGFVLASRVWPGGTFAPRTAAASLACFVGGISLYIVAVRFMQALGIGSAAIQTAVWFFATVVALAVFDGSFAHWTRTQQATGVLLAAGLAWLIVTTERV